jgi:sugar/nucleoside kinase (ribokinase family)
MTAMLRDKLGGAKPDFTVVAMPDFYLDYLVSFPGKFEEMTASLTGVAARGGGNILGWKHVVGRGGNTSNLVAQLAVLGVKTWPIIETDSVGHAILSKSLAGVDLSHVKTSGSLASTMSLETEYSGRRANVMVSNPGSHSNFGPEKLSPDDKKVIREASFVCVLNWGQNQRGTDLAEEVFKMAKEGGAVTFFDPGDPTPRAQDIPELNRRVLTRGLTDVLSVNRNELLQLAASVREEDAEIGENPLFEAASVFSMLAIRVDLHTPQFSATFINGQRERVPCPQFQPAKVTGAGDMWNGADIFAQGMGLEHRERLTFANATAAAYLKRSDLDPPTLKEILREAEELEKVSGH